MAAAFQIVELAVGDVDRVEALWGEMVAYHREVVEGAWPVRPAVESWARRRPQYVEWLTTGSGQMFAAVPTADVGGEALGYAVVVTAPPGPTWDLGETAGELESLVVATAARGGGIGTALIERCREVLRAAGVDYWTVGVVEVNAEATRLYERAGFGPYYRQMGGRV